VTRPAAQAERLCKLLEEAGYEAVRLPALEIVDVVDMQRLAGEIDRLESYDLAIFVSVNAVNKGLEYILARRTWPSHTRIATVGARSAEALAHHGLAVDLVPEHQFNSEALLALDELQDMAGRRVIIFRGNGGREHLHDTLVGRGATVEYAEVYRRACPVVDDELMGALLRPGVLYGITITSNESLQNLLAMAGTRWQPWLREIPLVVVSGRQAKLAEKLGFRHAAVVAENASDEAIVAALQGIRTSAGAQR
jgi:uroporphyrinogen-III synthase